MSLPNRYFPMAFYFWLSIVFHTRQVLRHLLHRCNLLRPSCEPSRKCYQLYPIPIAPSVRYHVGDLSYDLQTTSLHFPFLAFSPYPTHSSTVRPIAECRTARSGPYHMLHCTRTLCSFYLSFVFKTFVSTSKNKEVFPQNSDLSSSRLIVSLHSVFAPSHLCSTSCSRHPLPYRTIANLCIAPSRTPRHYVQRSFHCSRIAPLSTT